MPRRQRARHARDHWDARQPKKRRSVANKSASISPPPSNVATGNFRDIPLSHRPREQTDITSGGGNTPTRRSGYNLRQRTRGKDLRTICESTAEQQQHQGDKNNSPGGANRNGGAFKRYSFNVASKKSAANNTSRSHEDASNIAVQDHDGEENNKAGITPQAPIDAAMVRENRRRLRESEEMERRKVIARYKLTNNTEVFRPFLAPFIASGEHKRDLGEWQWDPEVERYWRINKTTGTKIWEPLWESFV